MNSHVQPPPRPTFEPFTGLPDLPAIRVLRCRRQWVSWGYVLKPGGSKWTKPPVDPATGRGASHSDPKTWSSYEAAAERARRDKLPGVGFVLADGDDVGGFDLDGCRDPETGTLALWAADILTLAETYAEVSPSGRGIRVFARGKPDKATKCDPAGVELYRCQRFLTVTGRHIPGTPTEIRSAPRTLAALLARIEAVNASIEAEKEKIRAAAGAGVAGEKTGIGARFTAGHKPSGPGASTFFRDVNSRAFANLPAWVPALFGPAAVPTGLGYRVSSQSLGRSLEEDLSITSAGGKDFGTHDMGDPKGGSRTAIDLVMEHGGATDAAAAALWLCQRLAIDPASLGWNDRASKRETSNGAATEDGFGPKTKPKASRSAKAPPPRGENDTRPVIAIRAGATKDAVDAIERALIDKGGLYQRANQIVFMGEAPVITYDDQKVTASRIFERGENALAEDITEAACLMKFDGRAGEDVVTDTPARLVKTLRERVGRLRFPILTAVINAPTLRPDGSLLSTPGYDKITGLFYDPRGVQFPPVPTRPTQTDVKQALADLSELLSGFPFEDEESRAVALSAILTACVRQAIRTAPLHAFSAPVAGSGKSKLVDIASAISTGREAGVTAQTADEAEMEKRLGALYLQGAGMVAIDNCNWPIDGNFLCAALTQSMVSIRPLGTSTQVEVPTSTFLTATGNNLVIAGDMTRRAIIGKLDPRVERPELREFDFEPVAKAKADRVRYVTASLTIMLAYKAAGAPHQSASLGSFEAWSRLVRDALLWVGCADPVTTMEQARDLDPKLHELSEVLTQWKAAIGTDPITVRRLIDKANRQGGSGGFDYNSKEYAHPDFREALMAIAGRGGDINSKRLGTWLGGNAKRRIKDGSWIEQDGVSEGVARWRLREQKSVKTTPTYAERQSQHQIKTGGQGG